MDMIQWLYGLQHFGIKLGLHNIQVLLRILDHPESSYPSLLVAGTNGKGSVAAMVHAMLCASGVRAGLFTSPHLTRPEERIRVGDAEIGSVELREELGRVRDRIERALSRGDLDTHPSFFEVVTAVALVAFRRHGVGAAVLEVGLGGRLDATNAVDAAVSVVVSIDYDHVKTLGSSLESIAAEKSGIVKAGRPLVSGVVRQQAVAVLQRVCRERGAQLIDARVSVRLVAETDGRFSLETAQACYPDLTLALAGRHQIDNARVAVAAFEVFAEHLGFAPDPRAVSEGLASVRWPGRLQWVRGTGGSPDLLLDGAHNPAGARTLARYLREVGGRGPVGLFGVMQDKLLPPMLESLAPLVPDLVIVRPRVERAADAHEVATLARPLFASVEVASSTEEALRRAAELAGPERFVLVAGSLYLVGEVLALIGDPSVPGPVSM